MQVVNIWGLPVKIVYKEQVYNIPYNGKVYWIPDEVSDNFGGLLKILSKDSEKFQVQTIQPVNNIIYPIEKPIKEVIKKLGRPKINFNNDEYIKHNTRLKKKKDMSNFTEEEKLKRQKRSERIKEGLRKMKEKKEQELLEKLEKLNQNEINLKKE